MLLLQTDWKLALGQIPALVFLQSLVLRSGNPVFFTILSCSLFSRNFEQRLLRYNAAQDINSSGNNLG